MQLNGDSLSAMSLVSKARMTGILLTAAQIAENPTLSAMAQVAEVLSEASSRRQTVVPFSLIQLPASAASLRRLSSEQCGIPEDQIADIYPCTPLQTGLLSLTIKTPGTYISRNVFKLPSRISIERFCKAWEIVRNSAEILRTRIIHTDNMESYQVVLADELEWHSADDLQVYLHQDERISMGYGLPLSRYAIITNSEDDLFFVWTIHHALYDGWSMSRVLEKVKLAYEGESILRTPSFSGFAGYVAGIIRRNVMNTGVQHSVIYALYNFHGCLLLHTSHAQGRLSRTWRELKSQSTKTSQQLR